MYDYTSHNGAEILHEPEATEPISKVVLPINNGRIEWEPAKQQRYTSVDSQLRQKEAEAP